MIINSSLGNYDGNVYENYFKTVKDRNPAPGSYTAPYEKEFREHLNRPSLEDRQRNEINEDNEELV
jgi:acyl-CoA oxidase